jgi:signal transduction histidine kinase
MLAWLHDEGLRTRHSHAVAKRASRAIGRTSTVVRVACCVVVIAAGLIARGSAPAWWLTLVALPLIGTALAIAHAREDAIDWMVDSRLWPVRAIGKELMASGWTARVNLPGALEALGPIPVMWMIGHSGGPFAQDPAARLIATVALLLYVWLSVIHWVLDSGFYVPHGQAPLVGVTQLLRGVGPLIYVALYAWLMSANTSGTLTVLPIFAVSLVLVYPVIVVHEQFLRSAEIERHPAVQAQRLIDGMLVHSTISNPLHFVRIAAHDRPAENAAPLLVYLNGELQRCLRELDLGRREPALITEIVEEVRAGLMPEYRERLILSHFDDGLVLSPADAVLARCVLSDLCCNALKAVEDGHRPHVEVDVREQNMVVSIRVADKGPGLSAGWTPGLSLQRLERVLRSNDGGLSFTPNEVIGTIVTARWTLDRKMEATK